MKSLLKLTTLAALVAGSLAVAPTFARDGDGEKKDEPKKDEAPPQGEEKKGEEPKKDEPNKDEPKKDDEAPPKDEEPKKDAPKKEPKKEEEKVDTESLEAKTLAGKLHVAPNWRPKAGTVELAYNFHDEPQLLDWRFQGADRVEAVKALELGVGSSSLGVGVLEPIDFAGDFEVNLSVHMTHVGPSNDLIFLFGVKKGEGFGVRYGNQFVKFKGAKTYNVTKTAPAVDRFGLDRTVDVRIVRKGDEIRTYINKLEAGSSKFKKKELDGKVGIMAGYNLRLKITKIEVKGVLDKSKL